MMNFVRRFALFALLALLFVPAFPAAAQEDPQAPPDILAKMRSGWESALYALLPIGADGRQVAMQVSHRKIPGDTAFAHPIPFVAEFYLRHNGKLQCVHSVAFSVESTNVKATVKWLHPRTHQGPIVLLHSIISDGEASNLIIFPAGIRGKALLQQFVGGGEGGGSIGYNFDAVDKSGNMIVQEDNSEGSREWTNHYLWDGIEFVTRSQPYFLIAATLKTRAEAEAFQKRHPHALEESVVRPSAHYPKLTPGYFVVLAGRFEKQEDARSIQTFLHEDGIVSYIKKAY